MTPGRTPLLALGGDGVISVASNEIPAEMARLCALARAGDWTGARALHERLLDLMRVNFISPNPVPVKAALAEMGLIEDVLRQPLLPLADELRPRLFQAHDRASGCCRRPRAHGPRHDRRHRGRCRRPDSGRTSRRSSARWPAPGAPLAAGARRRRSDRPSPAWSQPSRRARSAPPSRTRRQPGGWRVNAWVKAGILLGFRIPGMRDYRDGPILAARDRVAYGVLDILDSPGARAAADAGAPWRVVPGGTTARVRRPPRARRHHHAPGVPEHRRVGRPGHDGRLARARRLLRPGRRPGPSVGRGPGRRRPGAGRGATGHRGGRRVRRRWLRPVRRGGHRQRRGARARGSSSPASHGSST